MHICMVSLCSNWSASQMVDKQNCCKEFSRNYTPAFFHCEMWNNFKTSTSTRNWRWGSGSMRMSGGGETLLLEGMNCLGGPVKLYMRRIGYASQQQQYFNFFWKIYKHWQSVGTEMLSASGGQTMGKGTDCSRVCLDAVLRDNKAHEQNWWDVRITLINFDEELMI